MNLNEKNFLKIISLSLFHKFKNFRFIKYKGFLSKRLLLFTENIINIVPKFLNLGFYKVKILVISNKVNTIRYYDFFSELYFSKSLETIKKSFFFLNRSIFNYKSLFEYKTPTSMYRFLNKTDKKNINNRKLQKKIMQNVNFLTEKPKIIKELNFIKEKFKSYRSDFRNYEVFSIDPLGSLILDDTLHFKFSKKYSKFELGIHIPDVASFLKYESENIIKSVEKVSTCFLSDRKVDLFSILSSSTLYSLRQGIDRLSFSLIFKIDHCSNILSIRMCKSITRNKRSFSHFQFNKIIYQTKKNVKKSSHFCSFNKNLRSVLELKKKLQSIRLKINGKFQIKVVDLLQNVCCSFKNQNNNITEEFMLLCNVSLAEKTLEYFPSCSSLRKFSKNGKNINSIFYNILLFPKIKIDLNNFKIISKYMKIFYWKEKKRFNKMFFINKKIVSGYKILDIFNLENKNFIKNTCFGLNFPLYLQFTSPVRRVFDIFSNFFIFYIFKNYNHLQLKKPLKYDYLIYLYQRFYFLLTNNS
nr:exoribonuclease R [Cryptomonas curvata]